MERETKIRKESYRMSFYDYDFDLSKRMERLTDFIKEGLQSEDNIVIFLFNEEIYVIIQGEHSKFEQRGILQWREFLGMFNAQVIEHEEKMYEEIDPSELFNWIDWKPNQKLYRIEFYMIPLIREIYKPIKYGPNRRLWKIIESEDILSRENTIPYEIKRPKLVLRDYQQMAINEWYSNHCFGTISLATAGGKTIIAIQLIYELKLTTLIVVPTENLINQWAEEIMKWLDIDEKKIGFFFGKKKRILPITIATYSSIVRYISFDSEKEEELLELDAPSDKIEEMIEIRKKWSDQLKNYFSFLILDESHHIPAPSFRKVALESRAIKRLSLSATAERYDGNESLLYFTSGEKIFELDYLSLCRSGYVVPFLYKKEIVILTDYEKYIKSDLESKRRISFFNDQKMGKILNIVSSHVRMHHKILIFVSYVNSSKKIKNALREIGIESDVILSVENQKILSNNKREQSISKFRSGELNVLISTRVLDEGFNVPDCSVCIIVSGTSSERQLIQRIGRIVRLSKSNPNKIGYVYEIVSSLPSFLEKEGVITIDEMNHLVRNRMISLDSEIGKRRKIGLHLPPSKWVFNYPEIEKLAMEKLREKDSA